MAHQNFKLWSLRASNYICDCSSCMAEYGSCPLFQEHDISITHLKRMVMRSEVSQPTPSTSGEIQGDTITEFYVPGTFCAIAADRNSPDTIWFVQIMTYNEHNKCGGILVDDYGQS